MSKKLSAYNMHVASYLRSHPGMDRKEAFRAAASSWSGKGIHSTAPMRSNPGNGGMLKWIAIGVAAWIFLPKILSGMKANPDTSKVSLAPYNPSVRV